MNNETKIKELKQQIRLIKGKLTSITNTIIVATRGLEELRKLHETLGENLQDSLKQNLEDTVTYMEVRCQNDAHPGVWPTRSARLLNGKLIGLSCGVYNEDIVDRKYTRRNAGCVFAADNGRQLYWDNESPKDPKQP